MLKPSLSNKLSVVVLIGAAFVFGCQSPEPGVSEDGFVSAYGFAMEVSPEWVALTKDTIQEVLAEGSKHLPKSTSRAVLDQVAGTVEKGEMEMLMNFESADPRFTDNINILRAYGELPTDARDIDVACKMFGKQLSATYGRTARVHECGKSEVGGRAAMYSRFEGIVPGTTSSQVHVPSGRTHFVTITATYADERVAKLEAEFEKIIDSVRFL